MLDLSALTPGLKGVASIKVGAAQTAIAVGSGTVAVFASPMMVALMEAACVDCVETLLPTGYLSLGTHLDVTHSAPTPIGHTVTATASLISCEGRKLVFQVDARDDQEVIGRGTHTRMIVDAPRFNARLAAKTPAG
jgi:fluoroacetyl-CoA thioesterase